MTLAWWGRMLVLAGTAGALGALAPAGLLLLLPGLDGGFFGLVAVLLSITVAPLGALALSAGVILLLAAGLRRRGRAS